MSVIKKYVYLGNNNISSILGDKFAPNYQIDIEDQISFLGEDSGSEPIQSYYTDYNYIEKYADIFYNYSVKRSTINESGNQSFNYEKHAFLDIVDHRFDPYNTPIKNIENLNFEMKELKIEGTVANITNINWYITSSIHRKENIKEHFINNNFTTYPTSTTSTLSVDNILTLIFTGDDITDNVKFNEFITDIDNYTSNTTNPITSIFFLKKKSDILYDLILVYFKLYNSLEIHVPVHFKHLPKENHIINFKIGDDIDTNNDIFNCQIVEHHNSNRIYSNIYWNLPKHMNIIFFNENSLKYYESFNAYEYVIYCLFENDQLLFSNTTSIASYTTNEQLDTNKLKDIIILVENNNINDSYKITDPLVLFYNGLDTNIDVKLYSSIYVFMLNYDYQYIYINQDDNYIYINNEIPQLDHYINNSKQYTHIHFVDTIHDDVNEYYILNHDNLTNDNKYIDNDNALHCIIDQDNLPLLSDGTVVQSFISNEDETSDWKLFIRVIPSNKLAMNKIYIDDNNNCYLPINYDFITIGYYSYVIPYSVKKIHVKKIKDYNIQITNNELYIDGDFHKVNNNIVIFPNYNTNYIIVLYDGFKVDTDIQNAYTNLAIEIA